MAYYFLFSGITCGPCKNWHYLGHVKHVDGDNDDDGQFDYSASLVENGRLDVVVELGASSVEL